MDNLDLNVISVVNRDNGASLEYSIGDRLDVFGCKIEIKIPFIKSYKNHFYLNSIKYYLSNFVYIFKLSNFRGVIRITYETSKTATALQWLTPEQTLGKVHPYLFSQCQVCLFFITLNTYLYLS